MILTVCQILIDKRIVASDNMIYENKLESNGRKQIDDDSSHLHDRLSTIKPYSIAPGGASLNTLRAISQSSDIETMFIGAIGDDDNGTELQNMLQNDKTKYKFETITDKATAECTVFLNNNKRSMVVTLDAANCLSCKFIKENVSSIRIAKIIYLCGFFAADMPENAEWIVDQVQSQKLIFNLSNEVPLEIMNRNLLGKIFNKSKVIIGNYDEMKKLKELIFPEYPSVQYMMQEISREDKVIISTNGEKEICFADGGMTKNLPPKDIDMENLDTCGAGDYFAAGFIAAYYKDEKTEECVKTGIEWAGKYIEKLSREMEKLNNKEKMNKEEI